MEKPKLAKPKLAMLSTIVRSDLHEPLRHFRKIEVYHFYRHASYNDMTEEQLSDPKLICFKNIIDLFFKLKKCKPDIIQGNEPYTFPRGFGMLCIVYMYSLLFKTPYFFPMLENRPPEEKFGKWLSIVPKIILRSYAARAKVIIALNNGAERNLLKVGVNKKKIKRLMWGCWGVDIDKFKPNQSIREKRRILFVGTLDERKGVQYLLEAFEQIVKKYADAHLDIVGDGPLKIQLANTINEKGLAGNVKIHGTVKNTDLPEYFQRAYVTVTPSITTKRWEEQVGMVNLQSLACGTPVISTKSGAIPEYCTSGSILVKEKNTEAILRAIIDLFNSKLKHSQLAKEGTSLCKEKYDAVKNIKNCEKFVCTL